jgi:hypothetical protein
MIGIDKNIDTPESGLFITDLPGVTLRLADAANQDELSGYKLIEDRIKFAKLSIQARLRDHLKDKFKVNTVIENGTVGFRKKNIKPVSTESGKLKGFRIRINQYPYLKLNIHSITLDGVNDIYVYDLMSNTLLDTIEVDNYRQINKSYSTKRQRLSLFICTDSDVPVTETSVGKISGCAPCANSISNRYISFNGAKIDNALTKIDSNIQANTGTHGISIEYTLSCDLEPFIENLGNLMAYPLLYRSGVELMKELKHSRRLNSIILIDANKNQAMLEEFEEEYERSITSLLHNMKTPTDICFSCNSKVQKVVQLP